ncbi:hypothetical protein EPO15_01505, partial [bacterium]
MKQTLVGAARLILAVLLAVPAPASAQVASRAALKGTLAVPGLPTAPGLRLPNASAPLLNAPAFTAPALPSAPKAKAATAAVPAVAVPAVLGAVPAVANAAAEAVEEPIPAGPSRDYARMFEMTRRLLSRPEVRKFLREAFKDDLLVDEAVQAEYGLPDRIKEVSESQVMLLLQHNAKQWPTVEKYLAQVEKDDAKKTPDAELHAQWRAQFKELLADEKVRETFRKFNDPLTPMRLDTHDGGAGYANAKVYANHQTLADGKTEPAADLKQVLIDFISGAEKEIVFNVFDFDLQDVADALIERAKAGVVVQGGIDKNV